MLTIDRIKHTLNNHTISYSNIIFWLENVYLINHLVNVENGVLKKEWRDAVIKDGVKILNEGWFFVNTPDDKNYTIEELLKDRMGIQNIPYFEKYFNRYVRTWYSFFMEGYREEDDKATEEKSEIFNWYPIDVNLFLWISSLSNKDYNIDLLVNDLVMGKDVKIDSYILKKQNLDETIMAEVIAALPGKVEEYKKGKTNLINLFLGEYLKRLKDKNIDKAILLTGIKNFIEQS